MANPSVGRLVHYIMPNGKHRPAIIVNVNKGNSLEGQVVATIREPVPPTVNLQVFTDCTNDTFDLSEKYSPDFRLAINSGMFWAINVRQDEIDKEIGTWHWQEYVE